MFEISSLLTSRLRNPTLERKKEEKNSRVHEIARVCTWQGEPRARDIAHSRAHLVVPVLVAEDAWVAAESSASEIRVHLPCVQKEREKKTPSPMRLRFFAARKNRVVVDFRRSAVSREFEN